MGKKQNIGIKSIKTNLPPEQENYIRGLETSVKLLQSEIESLRNNERINKLNESEKPVTEKISNQIRSDFLKSTDETELVEKLHSALSKEIPIIESNIYLITSNKKIQPYSKSNTASKLYDKIENLEEQGIIDWAIEKKELSFIMDLEQTSSKKAKYIIIYPIYTRGIIFSIFFALTNVAYDDLEKNKIDYLKLITEDAALALDNIKSLKEIELMNQRLNYLNKKMMESSLYVSIGEFTSSIVRDMMSPINIIRANLDLIESNIGDVSQRINIIRKQINIIDEFKNKLNDLTLRLDEESTQTDIDLCKIIDDVLFFTNSQFQREGIRVFKEYEDCNFIILGYKSQIEQLIFNILLKTRDYLIDGGDIRINLYKDKTNKITLTFSDNGRGLSEDEKNKLLEPLDKKDSSYYKTGMNLYYSKQIIDKHKGKIAVFSEIAKGTTIKITFPTIK